MPYVRETTVKGHDYYQLVEGRRVNGKVKQKVLKHLGRFNGIEEARAAAGVVPNYIERLEELGAVREWSDRAHRRLLAERATLKRRWYELADEESEAAKEIERRIEDIEDKMVEVCRAGRAAKDQAAAIYDALPAAQREVALRQSALAKYIVRHRERVARLSRRMAGLYSPKYLEGEF